MTRKDFIKVCGILGIGIPAQSLISGCSDSSDNNFSGKVVIIGAGAGGMASGYLLKKQGIDFEILEASPNYGGRMKINTDFADFPIPLGSEWIHTDKNIFERIVDDNSVDINIETKAYTSNDTFALWENGELEVSSLNDSDLKFVNSSWFNFFEDYILPSINDKISLNTIVQSIDYSGDQVVIETQGNQFTADKVIIATPLKILQLGDISFSPALPSDKLDAINETLVWDGFKAFIEFSEKFYDTTIGFNISPETIGQKLYYDASYGQNTSKNILGLFTVGTPALDYSSLSDTELKDFILNELDEIYDNQASASYIKHISQNWNKEPFIKGGYLTDHADDQTVRKLSESVSDKLYFAGGAYTSGDDWVSVHAAAQSAKEAVSALLK